MLENADGYIIDLDGTVYRGRQAIDGAAEAIEAIRLKKKKVVFLSNRGNYSRKMCQMKLKAMGIEASEREIVLTSTVTAEYLKRTDPLCKAWLLGDEGLREEFLSHGVGLADRPEEANWLVITLFEKLTYADLNSAFRAVRHGAKIIATNEDKTFPGDDGDFIDVAGMIGAIVHATGESVSVVIGKPSTFMSDAALAAMDLSAERCLIIGDSLASDIALGKRSGIRTALVLSGSTSREQAEAATERPDFIWESLLDLRSILAEEEMDCQLSSPS
ncbi:HAD-IIA family hydrolase [Cohnella lupini]|uniref:Arabinose operon protein AraL n=1 Tax=Cohnella lupini TaxID=1294267 RepID=A0A3D9I6H8_9BACL|nr:HAD-IIA family hydrolase [Cohnella lupini]RED56776.1 arabinose operon protein AraL [Cohnella lupini]